MESESPFDAMVLPSVAKWNAALLFRDDVLSLEFASSAIIFFPSSMVSDRNHVVLASRTLDKIAASFEPGRSSQFEQF